MKRPKASTADALARMKRQKRANTKPELLVRQVLRRLRQGYRVNSTRLPGSPDIANVSKGWAIFVHGCYWHRHEGCARTTTPKANREWWVAKFQQNVERDARKKAELEALGLRVLVIWECETNDMDAVQQTLRRFLRSGDDGA